MGSSTQDQDRFVRSISDDCAGLRKKLKATEAPIAHLYAALADGTVADKDMFCRSTSETEVEREDTLR